MLSKEFSSLTHREQSEFMSKIILMAQSEDFNLSFNNLLYLAVKSGFFEKVSPGDPSHPSISDLDNPIENGISLPKI